MTIGQLYNAANVVVGQAACYVAPQNTALPLLSYFGTGAAKLADPFDPTPFTQARLSANTTITAGTFTLSYVLNGVTYTTVANTFSDTAAVIAGRIVTALAPLNAAASEVLLSGGPASAPATPISIVLVERLLGGVWSLTPTGITGGTLSITSPIWTPVGATDQGWKFSSNKSTTSIGVEEQSSPVKNTVQSQSVAIEGVLSEDISRTLAMVYNMLNVLTAPATGIPGFETLSMTDNLLEYACVLVMSNALSFPRWIYVPSSSCIANVSAEFRRAAAKHMYAASFQSDCPTSAIQIINIIAPGT